MNGFFKIESLLLIHRFGQLNPFLIVGGKFFVVRPILFGDFCWLMQMMVFKRMDSDAFFLDQFFYVEITFTTKSTVIKVEVKLAPFWIASEQLIKGFCQSPCQ